MTRYKPAQKAQLPRGSREIRDGKPCGWPEQPGSWIRSKAGLPVVRCADCPNALVLRAEIHTVNEAGKVHPSIGCKQCGWHVWGILLEWGDGSADQAQAR